MRRVAFLWVPLSFGNPKKCGHPPISKKPLKPDGRGITPARRASTAKYVVANIRFCRRRRRRQTISRNVQRQREFGQAFIDWLVSPEGQRAIADYKINGEQLFYPNATDPNA
jgi:hypothetical protein